MKMNEGAVDRILRVIAGLALLSLLLTDSPYRWFALIGLMPLLTGIIGFCPGYTLFGISTRSTSENPPANPG